MLGGGCSEALGSIPPSSGFGFVLPSPAALGRPNCTDGHLAGTLGHGPCSRATFSFPHPSVLEWLYPAKERLGQDREALRVGVGRGLRHGTGPRTGPHLTLDQTLIEEKLRCSAPAAWGAGCREPRCCSSWRNSTGVSILLGSISSIPNSQWEGLQVSPSGIHPFIHSMNLSGCFWHARASSEP